MKTLKVEYHNIDNHGYPEDNWSNCAIIENRYDLFKFFKECYNIEAHNHSNYPLNGDFYHTSVKFYIEDSEVCNLGHTHTISKIKTDKPEYFNDVVKDYIVFIDRVKTTIPNIKKIRQKRKDEEKELADYKRLKHKYQRD